MLIEKGQLERQRRIKWTKELPNYYYCSLSLKTELFLLMLHNHRGKKDNIPYDNYIHVFTVKFTFSSVKMFVFFIGSGKKANLTQ